MARKETLSRRLAIKGGDRAVAREGYRVKEWIFFFKMGET